MARNSFREILQFLRFDIRHIMSVRLQTDKFALISDVEISLWTSAYLATNQGRTSQ